MYDVIIVGARCAGAATAMLLARAGHRVLLLDRMPFPSDTLSTLYIHQPGVARLDRWGVLDQVLATGCPLITRITFHLPGACLSGPAPAFGSIAGGCAPRRRTLDHLLVQAAVAAGAEFRPRATVLDLVWKDGAVAGVRHGSRRGGQVVERARLTVGADGRHSTVARLVRTPYVRQDPALTCFYYTYWSGIPEQGLRLHFLHGAGTACVPTQDGLTLIALQFRPDGSVAPQDRERLYQGRLRRNGEQFRRQLADGRQEDRLYCCADQPNFFRRAHGPGWALVGDAAHNKDPITARGITDAFLQAEMLADRLSIPLDDPREVEAALSRYGRDLLCQFTPAYESALRTARLDADELPPDLVQHQHDPVYVDRFLRRYGGIP